MPPTLRVRADLGETLGSIWNCRIQCDTCWHGEGHRASAKPLGGLAGLAPPSSWLAVLLVLAAAAAVCCRRSPSSTWLCHSDRLKRYRHWPSAGTAAATSAFLQLAAASVWPERPTRYLELLELPRTTG